MTGEIYLRNRIHGEEMFLFIELLSEALACKPVSANVSADMENGIGLLAAHGQVAGFVVTALAAPLSLVSLIENSFCVSLSRFEIVAIKS